MNNTKKFRCEHCDINFKTHNTLRDHCLTSKRHKEKIADENFIEPLSLSIFERNILERNNKVVCKDDKCIVTIFGDKQILVDEFVWDKISQYTISLCGKYLKIEVDKKLYSLHRFIFYSVFHRPQRLGYKIDHKNKNKLDTTMDNLAEVTPGENNRNKNKLKNCTSQYYGVYKHRKNWCCALYINNKTLNFLYKNERHAAYHHDLLIKEYNLEHCSPLNNIEKPDDFFLKVNKLDKISKIVIQEKNGKFRYSFWHVYSDWYDSYEEAYEQRLRKGTEEENKRIVDKNNKIENLPILRNEYNEPIINLSSKSKDGKITNITIKVDSHRYHEVLKLGLSLRGTYVNVNKYNMVLSRYLLNCTDPLKVVDHKDGDDTNYQMNNLRIVTVLQNNQNKGAKPGTTSKYVGVCKNHNKWRACVNKISCGTYENEYDAAMARDLKAYELNLMGNMYRINLSEELQINLFKKAINDEYFDLTYLFY